MPEARGVPANTAPPLPTITVPTDPVPERVAPLPTLTVPLPASEPFTRRVPAESVVGPVYPLDEERVVVPVPENVTAPAPLIDPACDQLPPKLSRVAEAPLATETELESTREATRSEITALEATVTVPIPKEALLPSATVPPLRTVPAA